MSIVVLQTHIKGKTLTIHGDPTPEEVGGFAKVQTTRYLNGQSSGVHQSGSKANPIPAYGILSARRFASLKDVKTKKGRPVKIEGLLPKDKWPAWALEESDQ